MLEVVIEVGGDVGLDHVTDLQNVFPLKTEINTQLLNTEPFLYDFR